MAARGQRELASLTPLLRAKHCDCYGFGLSLVSLIQLYHGDAVIIPPTAGKVGHR